MPFKWLSCRLRNSMGHTDWVLEFFTRKPSCLRRHSPSVPCANSPLFTPSRLFLGCFSVTTCALQCRWSRTLFKSSLPWLHTHVHTTEGIRFYFLRISVLLQLTLSPSYQKCVCRHALRSVCMCVYQGEREANRLASHCHPSSLSPPTLLTNPVCHVIRKHRYAPDGVTHTSSVLVTLYQLHYKHLNWQKLQFTSCYLQASTKHINSWLCNGSLTSFSHNL